MLIQKLASMDDEDFEVRASAANAWLAELRVERMGRSCRPVSEWIPIAPGRVLYGAAAVSNLHGCRYPIGDPHAPDFLFCNKKRRVGSYCAEHAKMCVR